MMLGPDHFLVIHVGQGVSALHHTCRNPLLTMIETASLASHTSHLPTSLSATVTGSTGLRLRRVLYESWGNSDEHDTEAEG
jgi:hypothetical protein